MAHNLYLQTMAFNGETPWHGLGTPVDHLMTVQEALSIARADFQVIKEPLYRVFNGEPIEVPDQFLTINGDTQDVLGVVGSKYEVTQTLDRLASFAELLDGRVETAGALGKGERFWIMAQAPADAYEVTPGDEIKPYFTITGSHDGSLSTEGRFTEIRVVCQNTMNQTLKGDRPVFSVRNTASAQTRLNAVADILGMAAKRFQLSAEAYRAFAAVTLDDTLIKAYLDTLCGDPEALPEGRGRTMCQNRRDALLDLFEGQGMGAGLPGVGGTLWGLFNAATEYADYKFPQRGTTDRTSSILFGSAAQFKQTAFDTALELVTVNR